MSAGEGAVFITIKCVSKAGGFKREGIKYFKGSIAASQVLQPGELLIANTDLTRAGDIVGCPMVVPIMSGEIITMSMDLSKVVEDDAKIDRDFLYYKLMTDSVRRFMKDHASGSTVLHLQTRAVPDLELEIPTSKPEQTKIAEILSTVDRAIEQTEALIAKQQRIKTGLMQDILTRGIDEHGNIRSEQTHKFKDSPLGRIPVEWEVKRLGESSEVCNSFRKPIAALVRENMKGDYPYYGPTGILDYIHEYRVDGKFVLIGEDGDHFLKFKTQEMTLLVEGKYNVNNHAHILRGKGNVLTEWLLLFFLHRDITLHLTRQGAGRFKLNKTALLELLLSVPKESAEQDRILKVMNTLRQNQISSIENLAKLRSLKSALMQDLLSGKKRVTPLLTKPQEAGA
ncbi:MAG: restriction endonuclease subunit S [Euryarchaeota archaeon]|nr:restriction endonuclease subunit S [Euryarchaeota archaeon]MBU4140034.1 restriction endonuclease subunit S [Euryarchaeota archaeon]